MKPWLFEENYRNTKQIADFALAITQMSYYFGNADIVVGVRMRRTKEVGEVVLKNRSPWQEVTPERQRTKDPAPLKVKQVEVKGREYVVCLNEEERRKDAHDRAAILESLQEQLRHSDKDLVGNKGISQVPEVRPCPSLCH